MIEPFFSYLGLGLMSARAAISKYGKISIASK